MRDVIPNARLTHARFLQRVSRAEESAPLQFVMQEAVLNGQLMLDLRKVSDIRL